MSARPHPHPTSTAPAVATVLPPSPHPPPPGTAGPLDERAYLDRQTNTWKYEDNNGDEWEWQCYTRPRAVTEQMGEVDEDGAPAEAAAAATAKLPEVRGRWVKVVEEDLIQAQQAAYGPTKDDGDKSQSAPTKAGQRGHKRRASPSTGAGGCASSSRAPASKKPKPITSVYVSNLPLDCTAEEIAAVFSRYGLLLEDDEGRPRIKMYHDQATRQFKGEALVVYFKAESVELAIALLDDTPLRAPIGQVGGKRMKVQRAEFPTAQEGGTQVEQAEEELQKQREGERRKLSDQEKKRIQKRVARMQSKLTEWDSPDEDATSAPASEDGSAPRTVVLKRMFTIQELEQDPTLLLDLKQDVRDECERIGNVTNVVLWDGEEEGIITVRFAQPDAARACVQKMHNRYFAGRRIDADLLVGKPRFRKSNDADHTQEEQRRDLFASWLQQEV
ncbi:hypothetical protein ACQY0O_007847 [Thecaphora frezii]